MGSAVPSGSMSALILGIALADVQTLLFELLLWSGSQGSSKWAHTTSTVVHGVKISG